MAFPTRRSGPMLGPRRGSMRPVVVVLVVLTVLVVGTIVLGANHTSPGEARTEALAYLDRVRPIIERSSATGRDIASLWGNAAEMDREILDRQLARAEVEADAVLVDIRNVPSTDVSALAHDLLIGALGGRAMAVKGLRAAFGQALNLDLPPIPVVQALTEVGRDLTASDGAYRLFGRNLPPGSDPPPDSRWVTDQQMWSTPVLGAFVTSLRNSQNLAPVHDLAVLVATPDPGPVGKEEFGALVLAQQPVIRLQVVVANQGNQAERDVPLLAYTLPFDGSPGDSKTVRVDLAPGQRKALENVELRPPPVGATFAIIVRIGAAPDAKPVDDEFTALQYVLR